MKMLIHFSNHWKHWLFPASSAGSNPSSPAKEVFKILVLKTSFLLSNTSNNALSGIK